MPARFERATQHRSIYQSTHMAQRLTLDFFFSPQKNVIREREENRVMRLEEQDDSSARINHTDFKIVFEMQALPTQLRS